MEDLNHDKESGEGIQANTTPAPNDVQPVTKKHHKIAIFIMCMMALLSSVAFSVVMSSLWPFVKMLAPNTNETFLGWTNSSFSIAQLLSCILYGYWLDRRRSIESMITTTLVLLVANILYMYAEMFNEKGVWVVFAARILMGLGAGNIVISRTVVARLSTAKTMMRNMSFIAICQSAGMFLGPGIQAIISPIGSRRIHIPTINLTISIYTLPSLIQAVLFFILLILVCTCYKEEKRKSKKAENVGDNVGKMVPNDHIALFVCIGIIFLAQAIIALNETYTSPLLMAQYAFSGKKTVAIGSYLLSACGAIASFTTLLTVPLARRVGERKVIMAGLILMIISYILYLPWGPGYPTIKDESAVPTGSTIQNDTIGGCPSKYKWCYTTPKLPLIQYIIGTLLSFFGFMLSYVCTTAIYAKIIGPFPPGRYMGWMTAISGLARIVGPVYVMFLFKNFGPRWTAVGISSLVVLVTILVRCTWSRIIPYSERVKLINAWKEPEEISTNT